MTAAQTQQRLICYIRFTRWTKVKLILCGHLSGNRTALVNHVYFYPTYVCWSCYVLASKWFCQLYLLGKTHDHCYYTILESSWLVAINLLSEQSALKAIGVVYCSVYRNSSSVTKAYMHFLIHSIEKPAHQISAAMQSAQCESALSPSHSPLPAS